MDPSGRYFFTPVLGEYDTDRLDWFEVRTLGPTGGTSVRHRSGFEPDDPAVRYLKSPNASYVINDGAAMVRAYSNVGLVDDARGAVRETGFAVLVEGERRVIDLTEERGVRIDDTRPLVILTWPDMDMSAEAMR